MRSAWTIGLALAACGSAAWGSAACGARRWSKDMQTLNCQLAAARRPPAPAPAPAPARYDAAELTGLPAPVRRYFRAALIDGQPLIAAASIDLAGRMNMSATGESWKSFTSTQQVVVQSPGFLWDARIAMWPGVPVRVVDGYIAGEGRLRAALYGLIPLADLQGRGEIARGELIRYFAEMAWYPTALLPSQGVRWDAVDETSANATLVDGPLSVTLLFRFNEAGLIASAHAAARGAMVGKTLVMQPWEGHWSRYQQRCGMQVPTAGEAVWLRPQGSVPYFRGDVTSLRYERVP